MYVFGDGNEVTFFVGFAKKIIGIPKFGNNKVYSTGGKKSRMFIALYLLEVQHIPMCFLSQNT